MNEKSNINNWNYLIVTASNDAQAQGYRRQLDIRKKLGLLNYVEQVIVVPDPGGRRVGSGTSTLCCLTKVLQRELSESELIHDPDEWRKVLQRLRVLIVHAGGDSRRLPAYGPCGKIFVPVPGDSDSFLPLTLFDRQLPIYLSLPALPDMTGQVVVTAGDVLLNFDPAEVRFSSSGITGLGCQAIPEEASRHGVYVGGAECRVKTFLQKPSVEAQRNAGAIDKYGQSVLDIGIINFDAETAARYLDIFGVRYEAKNGFEFSGQLGAVVNTIEMDLYREICCGLGTEARPESYVASVSQSGSKWSKEALEILFDASRDVEFYYQSLSRCDFLHFGTSRQVISSGISVLAADRGVVPPAGNVEINNAVSPAASIAGNQYWLEGCRINSKVTMAGMNLLAGMEVETPLQIDEGMCLDCLPGLNRSQEKVRFVRVYGVEDSFKEKTPEQARICNMPLAEWAKAMGASDKELWPTAEEQADRTVFNARIFPAVKNKDEYKNWLWMFDPESAGYVEISEWHKADRYSLAEMSYLTDNEEFFAERYSISTENIGLSLRKMFLLESEFSVDDLAMLICYAESKSRLAEAILNEARWQSDAGSGHGLESFISLRMLHTFASAVRKICDDDSVEFDRFFEGISGKLDAGLKEYLTSIGLGVENGISVGSWCDAAIKYVFGAMGTVILSGDSGRHAVPKSSLRKDEIVWARAPARMDTGGGWTDTPPYSLEYGGSVVNTAVNLNGQPPIHVYARVIDEPVIRIASIDIGERTEITQLDKLLDFNKADSSFGLAKAALALCGFSPQNAEYSDSITLTQMLERFGGGLELTTLAAIPKGSGLGTSSIVGAVLIAALKRVMGQTPTQRQLFNDVLKLEQSLTTGGGWQDQIGGSAPGAKIVSARAGLIPDTRIHYLPADVIDPVKNSGQTLLYYTGITRLAKNILEKVVGGYLNRSRNTMATLRQIYDCAGFAAEAMSLKDIRMFGKAVDRIWKLNVQLDPDSTNPAVEELMSRIGPYVFGAKLLGAGGGGFILMVAKSVEDAAKIRQMLENQPPNDKARFFDYNVNTEGLAVTVC